MQRIFGKSRREMKQDAERLVHSVEMQQKEIRRLNEELKNRDAAVEELGKTVDAIIIELAKRQSKAKDGSKTLHMPYINVNDNIANYWIEVIKRKNEIQYKVRERVDVVSPIVGDEDKEFA